MLHQKHEKKIAVSGSTSHAKYRRNMMTLPYEDIITSPIAYNFNVVMGLLWRYIISTSHDGIIT